MTQIARYGHMLKVNIGKVRAKVKAHYRLEGSVMRGDRRAWLDSVQTVFMVESTDEPEQVARVVRVAKNGCFARQALLHPVSMEESILLNGRPLEWEQSGGTG
ncbi:MAG: hypothetical protein ACE5IG_02425 [Dehalococcoidia bacterium]